MLEVERLGGGRRPLRPRRHRRPVAHLAEAAGARPRWSLIIPSRPGFGASPPLERNDFELEAPMFAELLDDGAHLVGHSYGAVIALLAAAERPQAVHSLSVSEPGWLRMAEGTPEVDEMIASGERLFSHASSIHPRIPELFRGGAGSASVAGGAARRAPPRRRAAQAGEAIVGGRDPAPEAGRRRLPGPGALRGPFAGLRGGLRRPGGLARRRAHDDPGTGPHRAFHRRALQRAPPVVHLRCPARLRKGPPYRPWGKTPGQGSRFLRIAPHPVASPARGPDSTRPGAVGGK